jgi:ABC-2 type transport system ATP-binding protein
MSDSSVDLSRYAVRTSQLTRYYGSLAAVDHLGLEIPSGEIFGLLGPNGAGKTTTIKMLTTLLPPSSGSAFVAGFDVSVDPVQVRRHIGYVPQLLSADGALTAEENMTLSARLYSMPRSERAGRIREALRFMDLEEFAGKVVQTYSGGMIRRLEIAQALLHRPDVIFLDEPTIGLDPMARHAVWDRLIGLRKELGLTVLLTTHDMEEADVLCDGLALMHHGKIVVTGTPAAIKAAVGPEADLDDAFVKFCGETIEEEEGEYRHVRARRKSIRQRG